MTKVDQELLQRIEELKNFCEVNGYPLSEVLEEELIYYKEELK
jgi:hypothetical protein